MLCRRSTTFAAKRGCSEGHTQAVAEEAVFDDVANLLDALRLQVATRGVLEVLLPASPLRALNATRRVWRRSYSGESARATSTRDARAAGISDAAIADATRIAVAPATGINPGMRTSSM
jgi:hypothetical protein